jgi:hypothetical protein
MAPSGSTDRHVLWVLFGVNLVVSALLITGLPVLYVTTFGPWLGALVGFGLGAFYRVLAPRSRVLLIAALLCLWLAVLVVIALRALLGPGPGGA